jgi:hypothetical protein
VVSEGSWSFQSALPQNQREEHRQGDAGDRGQGIRPASPQLPRQPTEARIPGMPIHWLPTVGRLSSDLDGREDVHLPVHVFLAEAVKGMQTSVS